MNDIEILSDGDVALEVDQIIDVDKTEKQIETIVVDDETNSQSDHNNETNSYKGLTLDMDSIYRKNKLLAEFIEKCLNLEHSDGMLRIINRTLLRVYKETDENYKNSPEFEKVLQKEIRFIEVEPHKKFTHIRNVIDALKSGGVKKRVRLTTIATKLNNNNNTTMTQRNKRNKRVTDFGELKVKRSKNNEIIDLDSDPNDIINLVDEDQNDVIVLDERDSTEEEKENNRDVNEIDDNDHECNKNRQNDSEEGSFLTPQIEVVVPNNPIEQESMIAEPVQRHNNHNGQFNVPMTIEKTAKEEEESRNVEMEIRKIENQIENYKKIVQQLDEAEVTNDNMTSPYLLSEKVKAKIVSLYKRLCKLIGSESNKKRTVRLTVQDGHPAGPVKRLEEFINSNIEDNGNLPFPDFRDVTMCVLEANEADGLGWNKGQILKEATALFTQCGRALQRRRQKREWKDLLATVKTETLEFDPADEDPILAAKLEKNHWVALCKEHELLDRYSRMQDMSAQEKLNKVNSLPVLVAQNDRIIDSCENINVRNEASYIINDLNVTIQNKANNMINHMNIQKEAGITIEVPIVSKDFHENIATNHSGVANNTSSLVIIKTEVSVEFEPPENYVRVPEKSKESLHIDEKNTDDIPCSQIIRMEEDIPIETDTVQNKTESLHLKDANNTNHIPFRQRLQMEEDSPSKRDKKKPNVQNNEIDREVGIGKNEYHPNCLDIPRCQLAASSSNIINNVGKDTTINSDLTAKTTEEHSQEDIGKKKQNGGDSSLVNAEANSIDAAVKIKKEPIDIVALLDGLGNNFTAHIVDIEDPFLVIEISDSSDEE